MEFVQDNHIKSRIGVLRGIHFQRKFPQGRLVRVIKGKAVKMKFGVDMQTEVRIVGEV